MKKVICNLILMSFVACTASAVENSIIPTMEYFKSIDNLPSKKFTNKQFIEISEALGEKENSIRLVTYNMLYNVYDHFRDEENRWPNRLPRIVELIKEMMPDIISTQELYPDQAREISELLSEDFSFFLGQKDKNGESFGIFYRKNRFELLFSKFLDPLSMIQLRDLKTDKIFAVFNTHLSFPDIEKREFDAHRIVEITEPVSEKMAIIFTGDLNTFPSRLDITVPFYDGDYIHRILSKGALKNSQEQSLIGHFGPISTFTNDENNEKEVKPFQGTGTPGVILDHIYVSDKVIVLTHAVEKGTVDGHFPSDHMPVLVDVLIK